MAWKSWSGASFNCGSCKKFAHKTVIEGSRRLQIVLIKEVSHDSNNTRYYRGRYLSGMNYHELELYLDSVLSTAPFL